MDLLTVEMRANSAVTDGALLKRDQSVSFSVDGIEGSIFEGRVARINPVAEEGSRRFPFYAMIGNPEGLMLGGIFAAVRSLLLRSMLPPQCPSTPCVKMRTGGVFRASRAMRRFAKQSKSAAPEPGD